MNQKNLMPAVLLVGAALLAGQNKPALTARELFYAPASVTAGAQAKKSTGAAVPKSGQTKSEGQQVAVVKKSTSGNTQRPVEPVQQQRTEEPVMLVTASYNGPRPLGLRYSLLKFQGNGNWGEVNTDSVFRSGDKIRVKVEANEDGYLYIVARGSSGRWETLFPKKEIRDGDNRVDSGEPQMVPNKTGAWTFDSHKGEEKLFLVLSRRPVSDLDRLIYDLNDSTKPAAAPKSAAPAETKKTAAPQEKKSEEKQSEAPKRVMLAQSISPIDDALVGRLRSQMLSRDLVFEKVDESTNAAAEKKEAAVYVVEKSGKPDARLVVDIKLQHD